MFDVIAEVFDVTGNTLIRRDAFEARSMDEACRGYDGKRNTVDVSLYDRGRLHQFRKVRS